MARRTSEQERIEYLRNKKAFVYQLTPITEHNLRMKVAAIAENEADAKKWITETYPMYNSTLITFTSKILL